MNMLKLAEAAVMRITCTISLCVCSLLFIMDSHAEYYFEDTSPKPIIINLSQHHHKHHAIRHVSTHIHYKHHTKYHIHHYPAHTHSYIDYERATGDDDFMHYPDMNNQY